MADQRLELVSETDTVIGTELRSVIHRDGLRHREVHVLFVTPNGQIVFQRRSSTKDSYPNLLDATAGGHVEPGQSYLQAAIMEAEEETGLNLSADDLIELEKLDLTQPIGNNTNLVYRMVYAYRFNGSLSDLRIEENDGAGFILMPLSTLRSMEESNPGELVPRLVGEHYQRIWQKLSTL